MMFPFFFGVICAIFSTGFSQDQDGYIFASPRTLKTGTNNELNFRRFGSLDEGVLKVQVFYRQNYDSKNESVAASKKFKIPKGEAETVLNLFVDLHGDNVYGGRIQINGTFGKQKISGTDDVSFQAPKQSIVIIQTDKPLYKPGETVKFRVLKVNKELKPFQSKKKITAYVEDPKGTRLFQYDNLDLRKGLVQKQFKLSEDPVKGSWTIKVIIGDDEESTNIDVKEYVLPKFDVKIKFPSFVLANAKTIPITVCAEYTYGEPVSGTLTLNASLETYYYERSLEDKVPTKQISTKINGCYTYTLKVSDIESNTTYYNRRNILVQASVTEDGTGVERSASETLNRDTQPLTLTFIDSLDYFKPGLPYNGKLQVANPDGTIKTGEPIEICVTIDKKRILADWWATKTIEICRNYTSNSKGLISYTILPQNVDVISMNLNAKSLKYDPATNKDVGYDYNQLSQPTANKYLNPYFSPSGSFIQIQPIHQPVACGSVQTLKALFTSKESAKYTFYYQVLYQSTIVVDSSVQKSFSPKDDVSAKYEKDSRVINGPEEQINPPKDSIPKDSIEKCPEAKESKYLPPIGEVSIKIDVNTVLSPSIYVLVYYVKDSGEVVADSMKIDVENCFQNKVKFAFGDKKQQPGAQTSVSVMAGSNSYCGIKAIDKSILLLDNSDQLTKEKVFQMVADFDKNQYYTNNPCYQRSVQPGLQNAAVKSLAIAYPPGGDSYSYQDSLSAFQSSGYLVISNLYIFTRPCENRQPQSFSSPGSNGPFAIAGPDGRAIKIALPGSAASLQSISEVRSNFPETWLFQLDMTDEDGTFQKTVTLPDTITEWIGSAVCINTADGLGISNTTSITGFQAFFIDYTLPVSVIRGEEFTVVVSIFSYADAALPITVNLKDPQGFKVTNNSIDGDICVQPSSSVNLPVTLKATNLGKVQITVSAESSKSDSVCGSSPTLDAYARDAIRKPIEVKPEGFPNEKVINTLFCPSENMDNSFSTSVTLKLPKDVVSNSTRAYVDITGNILGPAINNLDNLVQLPTGCGEQNMVKFTPNYLVLDYLKDIGQLTPDIKNKAISNLISGYQRELTYRRNDGSFSAFGETDNEGSMFLTAFVLRSFYEAQRYIYIDDSLLTDMQNWIISKQSTNGCFPNLGRIINIDLQGGIPDENSSGSITAYVLASLFISKFSNTTIINDALSCLNEIPPTNPYSQFLYAYTYALAGDKQKAQDLINEARQKIQREDGMESFIIVNGTKAIEIETDAYAVLTTLAVGGSASDALPYVRYLTSNLNPNGGFTTTQDTCVGLNALSQYASIVYKDPLNLMVQTTGGLKKSVTINDQNKLLVQRFKVMDISKSINIKAKGTGCGLIQTAVLFNTKTAPEKKKFSIRVRGDCSDPACNTAKIVTLVSYLPPGQVAGMSIVEIKLITGFSPVRQSLEDLKNDKNNNILRIDVQDNTVIVYFSEISNAVDKFSFDVNQVVKVQNAQPGTAKVYDYYANENSAATSYKINPAS